jgi:hypothetical protein
MLRQQDSKKQDDYFSANNIPSWVNTGIGIAARLVRTAMTGVSGTPAT